MQRHLLPANTKVMRRRIRPVPRLYRSSPHTRRCIELRPGLCVLRRRATYNRIAKWELVPGDVSRSSRTRDDNPPANEFVLFECRYNLVPMLFPNSRSPSVSTSKLSSKRRVFWKFSPAIEQLCGDLRICPGIETVIAFGGGITRPSAPFPVSWFN
jgi:hypothetical protein